MTDKTENVPAFPIQGCQFECGQHPTNEGMSLRDWFAGMGLSGLGKHHIDDSDFVAIHAFALADAMLAARKVSQ